MAEQKKVVVPPKIPPPPPPRARTPKNLGGASLLDSKSPSPKAGLQPNTTSFKSPPERQPKIPRPAPTPPDLSEAAALLSSISPPSSAKPRPKRPTPPVPSRQPPVSMNPAGREPPTPKTPSPDESTPKKGFLRNVFSRTKDFFSRKKTTTYEPIPKQSSEFAIGNPKFLPKKKSLDTIIREMVEGPSTEASCHLTTTAVRLDDTLSDTESAQDHSSSYSKDHELTRSEDSDLGTGSQVLRFTDTSSEISASDLEEAVPFKPVESCRGLDHGEDQLVTIQVNAAADIRVATTVTGELTTCIRTTSELKRKGKK